MGHHTVLLLLDHVRAKRPYIRTVSKWVQELGLRGAFIFQWKLILLLLQGQTEDITEYLSRHRTQCIDVDSKGRKCKERMMSVIAEVQGPPIEDIFVVQELNSADELKHFFIQAGLKVLYESYVRQLSE